MKKVLLLVACALTVGACTKKSDDSAATANSNEILVGEYGSMTGQEATFGISTHRGIELAIDEKNAAGGVKGKKIKLVSLDNQGKSDEAKLAVTRLITQNKVVAVLGEVASSRSLAAAPVAQQNKVPMVTPSSTNPKVTEIGDYIFRVCFIDPFQGDVMAKFAFDNLKYKKVAVLREVTSDYSVGLADYFVKAFTAKGGTIVIDEKYTKDDLDFNGQLTQIRSKNPEAIFIPGYYTQVGLIARQARALGIKATLLGGDGWDSPKLSEIGKEAVNGGYFSNHYTTESSEPQVLEFINKYKSKYSGEVPDGLAAMGYDAAKVLIEAMERTGEQLTPQAIRDELAKTKDFKGVTGKITINEKRDAVKSAVVVKVNGTKNNFVTTINP